MSKKKLFDDWSVQLANTYVPGKIKPGEWFAITEKINGVRATYFAGHLVTRTGHKITGFDIIEDELQVLQSVLSYGDEVRTIHHSAFDGELRLQSTEDDNTTFRKTVSIVNNEAEYGKSSDMRFIIFDVLPTKNFAESYWSYTYRKRLSILMRIDEIIAIKNLRHLKVVPLLYAGKDVDMIEKMLDKADSAGMEGIMINRDDTYQFKRSNGLLKYKKFKTIDLKVVDFEWGTGKYANTMGALIVNYKGNHVGVGTGYTDQQRDDFRDMYLDNPDNIIGKVMEVKYKDITMDQISGLPSLQFPVFSSIREDKNTPDIDIS